MTKIKHTSCCVHAKKIRSLRLQKMLTQEELADKAGLSLSSVKSLERSSTQSFQLNTVRNIASILDVDVQELVKEKASMDIDFKSDRQNYEAFDEILKNEVDTRLAENRHMIDELLERYDKACASGQFDHAVNVAPFVLNKLRLNTPISMPEICSIIIGQAQAIAYDEDFTNNSADLILWIGNVIYSQPRNILTTHIDRERIWTSLINSANFVKFDNNKLQKSYSHLIDELTNVRFCSSEERVTALLRIFFFVNENWNLCKNNPNVYIMLSFLFSLFEDDSIAEDDYINKNRATLVIFNFLLTLKKANGKKPPIVNK